MVIFFFLERDKCMPFKIWIDGDRVIIKSIFPSNTKTKSDSILRIKALFLAMKVHYRTSINEKMFSNGIVCWIQVTNTTFWLNNSWFITNMGVSYPNHFLGMLFSLSSTIFTSSSSLGSSFCPSVSWAVPFRLKAKSRLLENSLRQLYLNAASIP